MLYLIFHPHHACRHRAIYIRTRSSRSTVARITCVNEPHLPVVQDSLLARAGAELDAREVQRCPWVRRRVQPLARQLRVQVRLPVPLFLGRPQRQRLRRTAAY